MTKLAIALAAAATVALPAMAMQTQPAARRRRSGAVPHTMPGRDDLSTRPTIMARTWRSTGRGAILHCDWIIRAASPSIRATAGRFARGRASSDCIILDR